MAGLFINVNYIVAVSYTHLLCYKFILPEGFQIAGVDLAVSGFTPKTLILLIIYFILGYALYAVMNSVCGAAVIKIEDLNSAMMPVSILVIIGFYLGYFTSVMGGGSGAMSKLAVYLPISSPFAVPFKLITGCLLYTSQKCKQS